ncbi:MAG: response regulator, partial [Acidobacteriota bacterium]
GALKPSASLHHDPGDPTSLPGEQVTALYVDRRQRLWVGTLGHGLGRTDAERPGRFQRYRHDPRQPDSISDDDIVTLLEDRRGVLWLTTHGGGLNRYDAERDAFHAFRHDPQSPTSLGADDLNALAVDRDDGLWIGTLGRGLDRLGPDRQRFRHVRHDDRVADSLGSDTVFSLHIDADDILWVGHAFGVDRLVSIDAETATFRHYTERDGLPDSSVWGLRSDTQGRLWIATNNGLASLDPRSEIIRAYDVSHGLQAGEFNLGAHHRGRDGTLYFGGVNGFNAFDPERLHATSFRPPLRITSLVIAGYEGVSRRDTVDDRLELGHRDHHFDVELAALDFSAPENNRYRYRLEGREDEWIELGTRRQLSFAGLDHGEYVLHIQGSNSDGVWSSDDVSLEVTVLPPPWRTWWAYSLYALACAAAVWTYVRQHRVQLERERQISERLRTVDRMREELIANTSHELRTPLFGIGGLAEAMLDDPYVVRSPITRQHLETIVVSTRRLNHLVDDLLDLSELRHDGGVRLEPSPVNLRALATDVLHLARPMVGDRQIVLANHVDTDLPSVLADEGRLHQILINLVGNAIKFTDAGQVEILAAEVGESQIEIRVTDTGIGIGAEDQERIFEPFEQVDGSTERRFGGTGLGLTVSRRLVELHSSRLAVTSALGAGSTFSFTLPPADSTTEPAAEPIAPIARRRDPLPLPTNEPAFASPPPPEPQPVPKAVGESSTTNARILVVDDEPVNRLVLSQHLADAGLQVVEASSGLEALSHVHEQSFDLVLLDVMMPKMSGYEVCRRLRERYARHELPIIFLTAKTQLADRLAGFAEGANDYLTKPVAKREMLARVETQLELLFLARHQSRLLTERSEQLETLGGLLPICAKCKKIRDDDGYWEQIETFIQEHSNARLTHGFCPPCADSYYAEIEALQLERAQAPSSSA